MGARDGMGQLLSKLTATAGLPWAAWHLATLVHFTSLTHTQASLHLWENEEKLFLAAPNPLQPPGSVIVVANLQKKELAQGQSTWQQQRSGPCLPGRGWVS